MNKRKQNHVTLHYFNVYKRLFRQAIQSNFFEIFNYFLRHWLRGIYVKLENVCRLRDG